MDFLLVGSARVLGGGKIVCRRVAQNPRPTFPPNALKFGFIIPIPACTHVAHAGCAKCAMCRRSATINTKRTGAAAADGDRVINCAQFLMPCIGRLIVSEIPCHPSIHSEPEPPKNHPPTQDTARISRRAHSTTAVCACR